MTSQVVSLMYPRRLRCRGCRRYFSFTVLDGQFCSYRCGGWPEPTPHAFDAPRQCTRFDHVFNTWVFKRRFASEDEAHRFKAGAEGVYHCDHCRTWHAGHRPR